MSYTLHTDLKAKSVSYGGTRTASQIKYIVVHYTGNKTDKAKSNANYYANTNTRAAGAHYFVDDTTVYQSIDDLRIAWAVGGSKYSDCATTGGGSMYGTIKNANSISIELCSTNGAITSATQENAIILIKKLMAKYNIPACNCYRHFDVTGKHCIGWAGWYGSDQSKWVAFRQKLGTTSTTTSSVTATATSASSEFKVKVIASSLNIRKGAGTNYAVCGSIKDKGTYTISKTSGDWGYLKSGTGWICITSKYVTKL